MTGHSVYEADLIDTADVCSVVVENGYYGARVEDELEAAFGAIVVDWRGGGRTDVRLIPARDEVARLPRKDPADAPTQEERTRIGSPHRRGA